MIELFGDLYQPEAKAYVASIILWPLTSKEVFSGYHPENVRSMKKKKRERKCHKFGTEETIVRKEVRFITKSK